MIKRRTDKLQKQKALYRDNHRCVSCGATTQLEFHHVFFHVHDDQRWGDDRNKAENGVILCTKCHLYGIHRGDKEMDKKLREYLIKANELFIRENN